MSSVVPDEHEHLTTGWESDVAPGDTLVRQAAFVHGSWATTVAKALGRPFAANDRWAGGFIADRGALSNPVVLRQPPADPAMLVEEINEVIPPTSPFFLASPWLTPDFSRHGLVLLGHPPLMVRFPAPHTDPPRAGVEVRQVRTAEELAVAERVLVSGYPMPELEPLQRGDLFGAAILDTPTPVWVGYVDGEPASVAAAHLHAGVTLVEYVAALPTARGRGAGAAVTWAATLVEPQHPAVLLASDDGRPVYEAMGYLAIERWTAWLRPAA